VFRETFQKDYEEPVLVLFTGSVSSACGVAGASVGPFYCPRDKQVYIDLAFYRDLRERFAAPGDFAQAYVIAHEVGHHVQNLLGIAEKVTSNAESVRLELQADCLAGLWAHHAQRMRQMLEPGDIEEALGAAAAIGDDRIQKQTQGHVVPESFTHGTSEQRMTWFKRGFDSGRFDACDTFAR
jgi:predicted metalloprotease